MRLIDADELIKAINTHDQFGCDFDNKLIRLNSENEFFYVPYIHLEDVLKCIEGMPAYDIDKGR